ncbi:unnamed protein product [Lactuca saligna]|uniref:Uncharacterized protein n=1 Tax=Lactuca saligna TaxID=75948 RepID=A0AA35Z082_LACSI|nr:unnamed protein product [Lactuca saligna]
MHLNCNPLQPSSLDKKPASDIPFSLFSPRNRRVEHSDPLVARGGVPTCIARAVIPLTSLTLFRCDTSSDSFRVALFVRFTSEANCSIFFRNTQFIYPNKVQFEYLIPSGAYY